MNAKLAALLEDLDKHRSNVVESMVVMPEEYDLLREALREREGMVMVPRDRLTEALNELGVPHPGYPSPVVNAVYIIKAMLRAAEGK